MRQRVWWGIGLGLVAAGCAAGAGLWTWKQPAIGAVEIGDSMAQVRGVLGAPKAERLGALLADGHRQAVWVYEASSVSEASVSSALKASAQAPVSVRATHTQQPVEASAYLMVFEHGQVTQVIEQHGGEATEGQQQER